MQKNELVALILAGGQGSRLGVLTKRLAKPAVPYGGKYRIIDFTLSNCSNSGIETVGVLTQYKPLILNSYIGIGRSWDLDRKRGGVSLLPPYLRESGGEWYKGTANAVYQNMDFVNINNPVNLLVLSGDHIYKMDYSKLLDFHKQKDADATIAVIEVPWDDASRFGIMNTDADSKIVEFQEKPKKPISNLASMGIYIFKWELLKEYLIKDEKDLNSNNDFGKNIIPKMVEDGLSLYAYRHDGYWKDVGTIKSLWEANMDLLSNDNELNLNDTKWRIYSVNPNKPPHYISEEAELICSMVSEGCLIYGKVNHSIIFPGAYIGKNTIINDSIIMPNARIEDDVIINKSIIGEEAIIGKSSEIGSDEGILYEDDGLEFSGITVIGEKCKIESGERIKKNSVLSCEKGGDIPPDDEVF